MNRRSRRLTALAALAGLVLACSGGSDDATDDAADAPGGAVTTPAPAPGLDEEDAIAAAETYLDGWDLLDAAGRASLTVTTVDEGPGVAHVHFGQFFSALDGGDPIPVRGAEVIVHVGADGQVVGANSAYTTARPIPDVVQAIDEAEATFVAGKAAPGPVLDTISARIVYLPDGDALRLGWSVIQTSAAGGSQVWVDAVSGEVADTRRLRVEEVADAGVAPIPAAAAAPAQAGDGCELAADDAPAACVFLPDPVHANDGEVPDVDDTADLLSPEPLLGLDDPESGRLVGEFVDTEPAGSPIAPTVEADGLWTQGRGEDGFEAAMTYYWIDRTQRLIQELGFDDVRNEPFPVFAVDPDVENNAFYDGAEQAIHMGIGPEDGINEGEDANGIVHEYGHAVLDAQVPAMIGSDGDAGAYHEGFGDLLAFLGTLEERGGDAPCLFTWTDQDCLRRLDTDKVYPADLENEVHADGEIYTGAVFDVLVGLLDAEGLTLEDCVAEDNPCGPARDRVLATLLASHEFLTGSESLPDIAASFLQANETAFGGTDADLLAGALADHGLDGGQGGVLDDEAQPVGEVPAVAVRLSISHTFRGDLAIELHVVDPDFEDLCTPLTLLAPDGADDADDVIGAVDISSSECAELVPPSADRRWVLSVIDQADEDTGVVNAFQVVVAGEPFLATGVPATIADNDPAGTTLVVDGARQSGDQEGSADIGEGSTGGPAVALEIAHTFVGDLFIRAGVVDADGVVLCSVPILDPDPRDDSDDLAGIVAMDACGEFFPPSPDRNWFLEVVDEAAQDEGRLLSFAVLDADGSVVAEATSLPATIPDDDPDGLRLTLP